jgi:hypothetical protein
MVVSVELMRIKTIQDWNKYWEGRESELVDCTAEYPSSFMVVGQLAGGYFRHEGKTYRFSAWRCNQSVQIDAMH